MTISRLLERNAHEERGEVKGVAIGIVTNNRDPEGLGRVKVRYPTREDQESFWARIAVPMAGPGRGTYFLPEVDDEVLVAFDQDDVRHPYVIGALWNGQDSPPQTNADGQNDIRQIKSRSGHELTFNDRSGSEQIELKTQAGHLIRIDDTTGSEKIEIQDARGSNRITIDSTQGSIEVESLQRIKLKSTQIDIEATAAMNIKATGVLTIKGTLVQIN
jgi:uncharacterized protein involved in type VI secretion and phage assembly